MQSGPFIAAPESQRQRVERLFSTQRARDALGLRIHEALALSACFFAGWPTAYVEWCALPLLICCFVRLTGHIHVPGPLLRDPLVRVLIALVSWTFLSQAWTLSGSTPGTEHDWLNEVKSLRFAALMLIMYPVMQRRSWFVWALLLGVACGQLSQVAHIVGVRADIAWLRWNRLPGRDSGWWDPVVGGSLLCAALGMHAAGAMLARSPRERLVGTIGVGSTIACILATGTRGAWIGAALPLGAATLLLLTRRADGPLPRRRWATFALLTAVAVVGIGGAWLLVGQGVRDRFQQGVREVRNAVEHADYRTDTGMRIGMWRWALDAAKAHPVLGTGAGGYRAFADQRLRDAATPQHKLSLPPRPHTHAHSWPLHVLASLGLIGAALSAAMLALGVVFGLAGPGGMGMARGYDAAPALGLLGLAGAGLFDAIPVNAQTAFMLYMLVAICVRCRPEPLLARSLPARGSA